MHSACQDGRIYEIQVQRNELRKTQNIHSCQVMINGYSHLSVFVDLPYPWIEIGHDFIGDRAAFAGKFFNGLNFIKDDHLVTDGGLGDVRDIDHGHIHTDSANNRGLLAME